jgi:hypothetical protein
MLPKPFHVIGQFPWQTVFNPDDPVIGHGSDHGNLHAYIATGALMWG